MEKIREIIQIFKTELLLSRYRVLSVRFYNRSTVTTVNYSTSTVPLKLGLGGLGRKLTTDFGSKRMVPCCLTATLLSQYRDFRISLSTWNHDKRGVLSVTIVPIPYQRFHYARLLSQYYAFRISLSTRNHDKRGVLSVIIVPIPYQRFCYASRLPSRYRDFRISFRRNGIMTITVLRR